MKSAIITAIQRGMVTLFCGLDSGIPDGLMGNALVAAAVEIRFDTARGHGVPPLGRDNGPKYFSALLALAKVTLHRLYVILLYGRPVFRPFSGDLPAWPESIVFGQAGGILLQALLP
jgi:hypothetical protein